VAAATYIHICTQTVIWKINVNLYTVWYYLLKLIILNRSSFWRLTFLFLRDSGNAAIKLQSLSLSHTSFPLIVGACFGSLQCGQRNLCWVPFVY
jgi:hypothetical protein